MHAHYMNFYMYAKCKQVRYIGLHLMMINLDQLLYCSVCWSVFAHVAIMYIVLYCINGQIQYNVHECRFCKHWPRNSAEIGLDLSSSWMYGIVGKHLSHCLS